MSNLRHPHEFDRTWTAEVQRRAPRSKLWAVILSFLVFLGIAAYVLETIATGAESGVRIWDALSKLITRTGSGSSESAKEFEAPPPKSPTSSGETTDKRSASNQDIRSPKHRKSDARKAEPTVSSPNVLTNRWETIVEVEVDTSALRVFSESVPKGWVGSTRTSRPPEPRSSWLERTPGSKRSGTYVIEEYIDQGDFWRRRVERHQICDESSCSYDMECLPRQAGCVAKWARQAFSQ